MFLCVRHAWLSREIEYPSKTQKRKKNFFFFLFGDMDDGALAFMAPNWYSGMGVGGVSPSSLLS